MTYKNLFLMQHVPKVSAAWFQMNAFCYGNETVWNLSS